MFKVFIAQDNSEVALNVTSIKKIIKTHFEFTELECVTLVMHDRATQVVKGEVASVARFINSNETIYEDFLISYIASQVKE